MTLVPRVIIVAAGQGSRLQHYTAWRPKCLLPFGSKTLLQHQLAAFAAYQLTDVHLVRGYRGEQINYPDITYHQNAEYAHNNVLNSLFYAESALEGAVIVSYADILFDARIVSELLDSQHDISIVVDTDWRGYYVERINHPVAEAEAVVMDRASKVVQIGKIITGDKPVDGEFIGMMKLSPHGAELFKTQFHRARAECWGRPFQRAASFQKAYLTDLLQEMADRGLPIHCVTIERGWKEIDTVEDYEKALAAFEPAR
jgi:choline kinase